MDARGGGLEQALRRWALALAERHDVTIVSHRAAGAPPVGPTPHVRVAAIAETAALGDALARLRPDVVSLHNRPQWARRSPAGATATVTLHNYPPAWKLGRARPRLTGAVSAVSHALAGATASRLDLPAGAVAVTPPSIDAAFAEERTWEPRRVVLSPNRLLRKKGVHELLAVAARPEFGDVDFAFVDLISPWTSPTAEHRALRAAIRAVGNAVLLPPAADARALAELYTTSAVVVCPVQEEEGLGLVALEAQACGVPLVTTDLGGLREATFAPNQCVPPHDPGALAAAIAAALRRRWGEAPRRRGEAPRRRVLARYTPEAAGAAFEAWLVAAAEG